MRHLFTILALLLAFTCCTNEAEHIRMRAGLDSINVRNRDSQPFTVADLQRYNHETIQNMTQNLVHTTSIGPQSYYLNYTDLHRGVYSYFGYNNPLSIWNF